MVVITVERSKPRGRPRKTWINVMVAYMRVRGLVWEDAMIDNNGEGFHGACKGVL